MCGTYGKISIGKSFRLQIKYVRDAEENWLNGKEKTDFS